MKIFPAALVLSLIANAALVAVLLLRPGSPSSATDAARAAAAASGGADAATGASKKTAGGATANARPTWERLHTDDLAALVTRLRAAGFPETVVRRIIGTLVSERFDARRLEIEKGNLAAPFWTVTKNSYSDPKIGPELIKLQREQTDLMKQLLGGNLADLFAGTEDQRAMVRFQIGNIAPGKLEQLYAAAMDYGEKLTQAYSATSTSGDRRVMLDSDRQKINAIDQAYRADLAKFLTPDEVTDFTMRNSQLSGQLRSMLGPFQPTEAEFRTIFANYQAFQDQNPTFALGYSLQSATPAGRAAFDQVNSQIAATLGPDRTADFQQAINPAYSQLNRVVARLDLPLSAAAQVAAVQQDVQQRVVALRSDSSLTGAERTTQLGALAQEATAKISTALGGQRGLDVYKEYGGQWLNNLTPRTRPATTPPKG